MALGTTFTLPCLKLCARYRTAPSASHSSSGRLADDKLQTAITYATDLRLFALYEGLRRGFSVATLNQWSHIDPWFIKQLAQVADLEKELKAAGSALSTDLLQSAKEIGFGDADIARLTGLPESQVRLARQKAAISPGYLAVGTEGSPTNTPYYYSSYETTADKAPALTPPRAVVLGAGPIRIGQGIEFDYSSVKAAQALREEGYASIIINNNPETVSTDGDVSDRLYFEPLTAEDVENILVKEKPSAVFTNLAARSHQIGRTCQKVVIPWPVVTKKPLIWPKIGTGSANSFNSSTSLSQPEPPPLP